MTGHCAAWPCCLQDWRHSCGGLTVVAANAGGYGVVSATLCRWRSSCVWTTWQNIKAEWIQVIQDERNLSQSQIAMTFLYPMGNIFHEVFKNVVLFQAAHSGEMSGIAGAWSPIGDVTTTMLWIRHKISTTGHRPAVVGTGYGRPAIVSLEFSFWCLNICPKSHDFFLKISFPINLAIVSPLWNHHIVPYGRAVLLKAENHFLSFGRAFSRQVT